ncbi:phasin family protein [Pelagibius marinus]|uniref:phasin family protein n=1 Tax=Pelagibius marinus TaxID=2762760 RepID=UPI0018726005|nr:phasin family protein [Pelagibius marinus]
MATKKTTTKTAKAPAKTPAAKAKTTKAAAAPALPFQETFEPVEAAVSASKETMEAVVKAGTQAASKSYEQAVALVQEQVEKASSSVFEGYDEVASLGKDNIDAYVQSSTVFAKGFEAMSKELMSFAQLSVDTGMANAKALFEVRTVRELIDLQTDFSRSGFDSLVTESAKLTELSMNLANETIEPIQARLNANVEKLMKPLAA